MKQFNNQSEFEQAQSRVSQLQGSTNLSVQDRNELNDLQNSIQNWQQGQGQGMQKQGYEQRDIDKGGDEEYASPTSH